MRHLALLLLLGCGRIGIDPLPGTDDAGTADAAPDAAPACLIDNTPCDDGNICTPSSTCSGGVCVGAPPLTCTVARSEPEFSTVQGDNGWFYGFWESTTDADATYAASTEFRQLVLFPGELWRPPTWQDMPSPEFTWTYLAWWGGHPGTFPEWRIPIRRWVSDVAGRASAVVHLEKADATNGDGTQAILVVDGVTVFIRGVTFDDGTGFTETVPIDVVVGSTVDLLLHPNGDDGGDTSTISMDIESR